MSNDKPQTKYDDYEKPSKNQQWHERSDRPIASKYMSKAQIEEHKINLVKSYKCKEEDITYDFQKIFDKDDEQRDDCLWLKYKMKCIYAGKPTVRDVFSIKIPIPEEMKRMAEIIKKQQVDKSGVSKKSVVTNESDIIEASIEQIDIVEPQRPKLRKPVRIVKKPAQV